MKLAPALVVRHPVGSSAPRHAGALRLAGCLAALLLLLGAIGLYIVPSFMSCFCSGQSKTAVARLIGQRLANERFAAWQRAHPERACPRIEELEPYVHSRTDPWDSVYWIDCVRIPDGSTKLFAVSAGEDQRFGTSDDIWSHR